MAWKIEFESRTRGGGSAAMNLLADKVLQISDPGNTTLHKSQHTCCRMVHHEKRHFARAPFENKSILSLRRSYKMGRKALKLTHILGLHRPYIHLSYPHVILFRFQPPVVPRD
jgi:hypothetical protein